MQASIVWGKADSEGHQCPDSRHGRSVLVLLPNSAAE